MAIRTETARACSDEISGDLRKQPANFCEFLRCALSFCEKRCAFNLTFCVFCGIIKSGKGEEPAADRATGFPQKEEVDDAEINDI